MPATSTATSAADADQDRDRLHHDYLRVRADSALICDPLTVEDHVIQTMQDVSPPKWHLAHTSWFFETFVLRQFDSDYPVLHPAYDHLFNSYYLTHGTPYPRPQRGLLARPTVAEVMDYRTHVDRAVTALLQHCSDTAWPRIRERLVLGLNHEQQHQELLLTDIKHIFGHNPLRPAYRPDLTMPPRHSASSLRWLPIDGGLCQIGHPGPGFAFDNEGPRHRVYAEGFALASRPVTNAEYLEFIEDSAYANPALWLSEGWATLQTRGWQAPLYWERRDGDWWHMTLGGLRPVDPGAPVCHVSYFEADAYARWAKARLPTEVEWELAAAPLIIEGNFRERDALQPMTDSGKGLRQIYGDVWEWTSSAFGPYPGYRPPTGAIGEYNGKFMSGQMVLRGGSCATPQEHIRASYRNFFYPPDHWQFSGLRLAKDR